MTKISSTASILFVLLGGCGGDNPLPTPSPTPSSTPTLTPTPTPSPTNSNIVDIQADQVFDMSRVTLTYVTPLYQSLRDVRHDFDSFINYSSVDHSYAVTSAFIDQSPSTYKFGSDQMVAPQSPEYIEYYIPNTTNSGNRTRLILFKPGPTNGILAMTYATIGQFDNRAGVVSTSIDRTAFALGLKTKSGVPTSGMVTYTGIVRGFAASTNNTPLNPAGTEYTLIGKVTVLLDFAGNEASGTLAVSASDSANSNTFNAGTFAFNQATFDRSSSTITGTLTGGELKLFLAGPSAPELGGTFFLKEADPSKPGFEMTLAGAFAAKR